MIPFINPWVILTVLGALGGGFFWGYGLGQDVEIANQSRITSAVAAAGAEAASEAASAISKLKVKHTTVTNKLEKEIHEKPVFVDCRSGSAAVELFNSTIPADTLDASGRGLLPAKDAPAR